MGEGKHIYSSDGLHASYARRGSAVASVLGLWQRPGNVARPANMPGTGEPFQSIPCFLKKGCRNPEALAPKFHVHPSVW